MEHARKMALVDPRLLDTLRSLPPPTDTVGKKVQALDDEMKTILDRKDLDDGTKVTLYNQVLQRYNVLVDERVKEPVRVIALGKETGTEPEEASSMEADVVNTVPKSLQAKARRLMEHLKRNVAWIDRGELIHEGVPVVGSNAVDLVHDICCARERPTIQRVGSRSHGNSALSTYPWSWSVTLPGEPTYNRQRLPPLLHDDDDNNDDR